jgi:hypothetical protein
MIHFFRLGLHGGCPFDIDWMHACSGAELLSFAFRLKPVEELYRSTPMGIGSADTSRLPNRRDCMDYSNLLPNNPARQYYRYTSVQVEAALCT